MSLADSGEGLFFLWKTNTVKNIFHLKVFYESDKNNTR